MLYTLFFSSLVWMSRNQAVYIRIKNAKRIVIAAYHFMNNHGNFVPSCTLVMSYISMHEHKLTVVNVNNELFLNEIKSAIELNTGGEKKLSSHKICKIITDLCKYNLTQWRNKAVSEQFGSVRQMKCMRESILCLSDCLVGNCFESES